FLRLRRPGGDERGAHPRRLRPADRAGRQAALSPVHAPHVGPSGGQPAETRAGGRRRMVRASCPDGGTKMSGTPKTAMVLAAGLGTRMRPLTDERPKALVEVGGRALIDHVLDRLAEAGVERAVVNVHWFADRLERHLSERGRAPAIVISDERAELLETGGGLKKAAPLLGSEPVFVANIDSVWTDRAPEGNSALNQLARLW